MTQMDANKEQYFGFNTAKTESCFPKKGMNWKFTDLIIGRPLPPSPSDVKWNLTGGPNAAGNFQSCWWCRSRNCWLKAKGYQGSVH